MFFFPRCSPRGTILATAACVSEHDTATLKTNVIGNSQAAEEEKEKKYCVQAHKKEKGRTSHAYVNVVASVLKVVEIFPSIGFSSSLSLSLSRV